MDPVTAQLQQSFQEFGRVAREAVERFQATAEQAQQAQLAQLERVTAIGQDLVQGYARAAMAAWRRASAWDLSTFVPAGVTPPAA
jgi:hypothetical protein